MLLRLLCLLPLAALGAGCALLPADATQAPASDAVAASEAHAAPEADPESADAGETGDAALPRDDAAPTESAPDAVATGEALGPRQRSQVQLQVMAGELAAGRGQPGLAAEAFVNALELYPDADLAARATQLALVAGRARLAEIAATRWLQVAPTAMDPREVLARLALQRQDPEAVYTQALAIIDGHAGGPEEGFRHVALLLSSDADHREGVLGLMQRLNSEFPDLAGAHYAHSLVALRFEDLDLAESSARRALALRPDSRDYRLLLVGVLTRDDRSADADPLVTGLLEEASSAAQRSEIYMTYARLLLDAGDREHARTQLRAALEAEPDNRDARYALGVMAYTDGELDAAETYFLPLTDDDQRGGDAWYQLGRIAEARQQPEVALEHYGRVVSGGQAIEAAVRQAAVLTGLDRVDEGRSLLEQLRSQFPPLGPRLIRAEAEMLVEADLDAEALEVYQAALAAEPDSENLLYGRSLVLEKLGRFPEAETDLRRILELEPDNPRALNALGYMLTVNTDRYQEAHDLIEAALRQEPDDAAVIDSMGWVLFKLGQAQAARDYLERALAKADDPEISAHLGEVLWSLGEKDRARDVLERALVRDPDHRVLRDTVDRLMR